MRAAVCVVVGVVLTALTAAASLLYAPTTMTNGEGGISSTDAAGRPPGSVLFKPGQVYEGFGIRDTTDYWVWIASEHPVEGEPMHVSGAGVPTVNVGWPLLAFTSPAVTFAGARSYAEFQAATERAYGRLATTAAPEFLRARPHRVVPGRILPLGFAVNTVVYAAVAGVALFAPGAVRRAVRRRGGRCVGCGYPLTGGERCPECGAEAPQGAVSRRGVKALTPAAILALAGAGGCQWNTSAISLAMSDEQIAARIGERLAPGMKGEEVQSQLDAWRLNWRIERQMIQLQEYDPELSAGGIVAQVEPHGMYLAFMYPPRNGELWLYFESRSGELASVRWLRPRSTKPGGGLHEPVDIPLESAAGERFAS